MIRLGFAALLSLPALLAASDFRSAVVVIHRNATPIEKKAATMLTEEIEKRTQLRLRVTDTAPPHTPAFVLELEPKLPIRPESFTLRSSSDSPYPTAVVKGADPRGLIFGTGYLLRQLTMARQKLTLASDLNVSSSPAIAIRGHQLGYRPKTNSYDGWAVPMWEQYIRELAIFGTNTIELIPPRSDDQPDSPHFPLPPMEMMIEMSRIADEYDLNVSVWYPAMDPPYSDPKQIESAVKEWAEVFQKLPRLDAIFVPGGDPGHTPPKALMALLKKQAESLRRYHPHAQVWISPQGFTREWLDEFYEIVAQQPKWLTGVVYGPQIRAPIAEFRSRVPKTYPIRFYPDITHSERSEFPVPDWDPAFALTEGREVINPRPVDESAIFHYYLPYIDGFVTYSEGCNDDVNKFIWSSLAWNPDAKITDVLRDFSRLFIGDEAAIGFAAGLEALEQNWRGPLLMNSGVNVTLAQFKSLETDATPQLKLNWRFQQALYRAYYDAYLRSRLLAETHQEELALSELQNAERNGLEAVDRAELALDADGLTPLAREYRARVFQLAEALFQSIHMQLSVSRYAAIGLERGANLDAIDFALNDRAWLKAQFSEIRNSSNRSDRLAKVSHILRWSNPGPGGFYDDLGNPSQQPHLLKGWTFAEDPGSERSSKTDFAYAPAEAPERVSSFSYAESLYDRPLQLRYTNLSRVTEYKVRVIYAGGTPGIPIRLSANHSFQIHPFLIRPDPQAPVEFAIPKDATNTGTLLLEWNRPEGLGGNGRGCAVAEVWLIPVPQSGS